MVKVLNKSKIKYNLVQKDGKPVVIIDLDDFEDIIEETDLEFKKSLKQSLSEYKKGKVVALNEL